MSSRNYAVILSPLAEQDIISILRYTGEQWGEEQLRVYSKHLDEALQLIGDNPEIGAICVELITHRIYPVGSHSIVYHIHEDLVGVARVLHQRMSIAKQL